MTSLRKIGFTLVEVMMVIAIISILVTITYVSYGKVQGDSRDAQRRADAATIENALKNYLMQTGSLPSHGSSDWENSHEVGSGQFLSDLVSSGVTSKVPVDPVNTAGQYYRYFKYGPGTYGCDSSRGSYGVFQVMDLEGSNGPSSDNPGFSCSGRNWNTEADYTFGIYEND